MDTAIVDLVTIGDIVDTDTVIVEGIGTVIVGTGLVQQFLDLVLVLDLPLPSITRDITSGA